MNRFTSIRNLRRLLSIFLTIVCLFLSLAKSASGQVLTERELTFQGFKSRIDNRQIQTPDDLMSLLPPAMLDRYALAFSSRSPHRRFVTPEAPRILMVSDYGFTLTLGTLPDDAGKIYAEFREIDAKTQTLIRRMIEFDASKSVPPVIVEDPVKYYAHDEARNCVTCHGVDHHDIWDGYKFWPGFFGQGHNIFPESETTMVETNLRRIENQPVYRHLSKMPNLPLVSLYGKSLEITDILAKVNANRIVARLRQNSNFAKYRAALLAALMGADLTDFISAEDRALYENQYASILSHVQGQQEKYFSRVLSRLAKFGFDTGRDKKENFDLREKRNWANVKFLCNRMGVSMDDWWMTFERDTYAGSTGLQGLAEEMFRSLLMQMDVKDKNLMPPRFPRNAEDPAWLTAIGRLRDRVAQEPQTSPADCIDRLLPHHAPAHVPN